MDKGLFIVLEGAESSQTATQFKLLRERLTAVGYEVETFNFPRTENESSHFVRRYQAGTYGPPESISPYAAALFYALDRFESAGAIKDALAAGKIVLANRFVGSILAEQGGKLADPIEQRSFFVWADSLDYQLLNLPRPALSVFIKSGADNKLETTIDLLCKLFPQDFQAVAGKADEDVAGIAEVNNLIWDMLQPLLPPRPAKAGRDVTVKLGEDAKDDAKAEKPAKPKATPEKTAPRDELSLAVIAAIDQIAPGAAKYNLNWQKADFKYFLPAGLNKKMQTKYQELMTAIIDSHKSMREVIKNHGRNFGILDAALPLAAMFEAELNPTDKQAADLAGNFSDSQLIEEVILANKLSDQSKPSKEPERIDNIMARIAAQTLPQMIPAEPEPITLVEVLPRNEFRVVVEGLYAHSSLPRAEIEREVDSWSYQKKEETLKKSLAAANGRLLQDVRYRFDITADRELIKQIAASSLAVEIKAQPATPRFGYDVPPEIEDAGLADQFISCFDKSLELFSALQAAGKEELGVYATLYGHKQRFQIVCTLESIMKARVSQPAKELDDFITAAIEKVAEMHPIIADTLTGKQPAQTEKPRPKNRRRGNRKK